MNYQYATQKLATRIDWASHVVAAAVYTSGLFSHGWAASLAAGISWVLIQGVVYALHAVAGPSPQ